MQGFAGDVAGGWPGQEGHGMGDVGGFAETAERDLPEQALARRLRHRTGHIGVDEAGRHHIHGDAARADFLRQRLAEGNDASIDCAKSIVEVFCRIVLDELDSPSSPVRPQAELPSFGEWVSAAVRVLKLGDNQNRLFLKLVSQHHKLTTALGDLRNDSGPVSHGRDAFLARLSDHHRRSAILSADAIVTFLHHAYLEAELDLVQTRLPYENERLSARHELIDRSVSIEASIDDEGLLNVDINLPGGDSIPLTIEPSRLLYQIDREAYFEALKASQSYASDGNIESGGT